MYNVNTHNNYAYEHMGMFDSIAFAQAAKSLSKGDKKLLLQKYTSDAKVLALLDKQGVPRVEIKG